MITVVTPADPLTLVSLDEAKAWLKVDYTEDDAIITMLIKSAYNWAEKFTNSSILERTLKVTLETTCANKNPYRLPYGPVQSVVSAGFLTDGDTEEIESFTHFDSAFWIKFPYYTTHSYRHHLEVTYIAGLPVAEVEEAYKEAILKTVFSSYDIRGNEVTGTEGIAVSTVKITREAKDILRSYIRYL